MGKNLEVTTFPQSFNNVTQCSNQERDSTYDTIKALNVIGCAEGPSERAVYGESADRALSRPNAIVSDDTY